MSSNGTCYLEHKLTICCSGIDSSRVARKKREQPMREKTDPMERLKVIVTTPCPPSSLLEINATRMVLHKNEMNREFNSRPLRLVPSHPGMGGNNGKTS